MGLRRKAPPATANATATTATAATADTATTNIIESLYDVNRLAMLHITSPPHPPSTTTTTTTTTSTNHCTSCCASTKRRSPSTPSTERRFTMKIILQQQKQHHLSSNDTHLQKRLLRPRRRLHGFSKLALSIPSSNTAAYAVKPLPLGTPKSEISAIPMRDNLPSAKSTNNGVFLPPSKPLIRCRTAPSCTFNVGFKGESSSEDKLISAKVIHEEGEEQRLPDEIPTVSKIDRASTAPSSTFDALLMNKDLDEKLYSTKKLKGMKDHVKEMRQWCGQLIHEDDEHSGSEVNIEDSPKDGSGTETEEVPAARVEKAGDCFVIQFKCPCEKVYQLLFSNNHIYYMLMPIQQDGPEKESEETISVERNNDWLVITTECPCKKGYRILLSGKVCFYELI